MIFGKEERLALILIVLVLMAVFTVHLFLSHIGRESFAGIYENTSAEGELVTFTGTITDLHATNTGGHLIIETDGPVIFFEKGKDHENFFKAGDKIKATGIISIYQGTREIIVEDIKEIDIL
ncbi:MAG: hypothetical protein PHP13_07180 [Methanomicrobium sp.]|nr:hypothetical protein [Methanomicrobium sp.]MDD4299595.1 hypothetical protein [Methanomicrobium sp.]